MQNSINLKKHHYNYGIDELAYFDEGKGEQTILLIHGFGEDNTIWKNQIEFLSQHYRVIAPNLPGVHCKPLIIHHSHKPSISNYVEVLHDLMHSLHIEKYFIFPETAKELGLQSVVNVFFEIDVNGKVDKLFAKSSIVGVEFNDADALNTANSIFEQAAMKIFNELPVFKPGKVDGVVKPFPIRIPVTYRNETQNFDPNDVFSLENIDWAPLFPKAKDVTPETSITLFKENVQFYVKKHLT